MASETYTVRPNDTLSAIASRHGVSIDDIVAANRITDANKINVGQILTIPTAEPESSESEVDSSWSETLLAFFDSLGRPIVGLAVRLVSGETETHATTDAGGRLPSVKGKAQARPSPSTSRSTQPVVGGKRRSLATLPDRESRRSEYKVGCTSRRRNCVRQR